jgi:alanine racemase
MEHYLRAELSRRAVTQNLRVIRSRLPAGCRLCAVVKADAYGHGLSALLATIAAGADALAVATVPEALAIRQAGYEGPILATMAYGVSTGGEALDIAAEAMRCRIDITLAAAADVMPLAKLAGRLKARPDVHVKVDTGMGRSGVAPADAPELVAAVRSAAPLHLAGIYTHFAASDEFDKSHANQQFARFQRVLRKVQPLTGVLRHAANSAAVADMPHTALDMVRPGISIYGYPPSWELASPLPVRPILRLVAPIVQIKSLAAGSTCGYGSLSRITRDSRVGIVPGGYGDGISRQLAGRYAVGVNGKMAPVLGRISMDQIIVDLTDVAGAHVGQTAELISPDPAAPNSVANLARILGTIPYEVTCRLGRRVTYKVVSDFDLPAPPPANTTGSFASDTQRQTPTVNATEVPSPADAVHHEVVKA